MYWPSCRCRHERLDVVALIVVFVGLVMAAHDTIARIEIEKRERHQALMLMLDQNLARLQQVSP